MRKIHRTDSKSKISQKISNCTALSWYLCSFLGLLFPLQKRDFIPQKIAFTLSKQPFSEICSILLMNNLII